MRPALNIYGSEPSVAAGLYAASGVVGALPDPPITYLLRDLFTTDAAAPLASPRTCEPGPGLLTSVQNDGQMSISGETLVFPAQTTPTFGDQGWYAGAITRACGRMLYGALSLTARSNAFLLGFNRTAKVNTAFADCAEFAFLSGGATFAACNNAQSSASPTFASVLSSNGAYEIAVILRSGTAAALGRVRGGAWYLIKGGAFADWTLLWTSDADTAATLYPASSNFASAGAWSEIAVRDLSAYASQFSQARWLDLPATGTTMAAPSADALVQCVWVPAASEVFDLTFRRTDADNCWIVRCDQSAGNVKLFERTAGVETQRGSTGTQTWTATRRYRIVVTARGTALEVRVENQPLTPGIADLRVSTTSSAHQTATGIAVSGAILIRDLAAWPTSLSPESSASYGDLAAPTTISVYSPRPRQVMQRVGASGNSITIRGAHNLSGTRSVEARWSGGAWATIATASAGAWTGTLTGLGTGLGTLEVRIADDTGVTASVTNVGIGDVFAIAGQSNAQGQAANAQAYGGTADYFSLWGCDYAVRVGADPIGSTLNSADSVLSTSGGDSVWPLVATSFVGDQGVPIMLIAAAQGGTSIAGWLPGSNTRDRSTLYGQLATRIAAQPNGIRAVLWWQGEADALTGQSQAYYYERLVQIATALHDDFGIKLMPCKLQNCTGIADANENVIRAAVQQAWTDDGTVIAAGPDLSGLTTDDSFHLTTDVNLSAAAALWWTAIEAAL